MPELRMYLVIEASDHFGGGRLFRKTINTAFCPQKGQRIVLFPYEGEPSYDGPMGVVKEVYWDADGGVSLDFEHYVVDPSDQMERHIRTSSGLHGWYTDRDGDLVQKLLDGGWTK